MSFAAPLCCTGTVGEGQEGGRGQKRRTRRRSANTSPAPPPSSPFPFALYPKFAPLPPFPVFGLLFADHPLLLLLLHLALQPWPKLGGADGATAATQYRFPPSLPPFRPACDTYNPLTLSPDGRGNAGNSKPKKELSARWRNQTPSDWRRMQNNCETRRPKTLLRPRLTLEEGEKSAEGNTRKTDVTCEREKPEDDKGSSKLPASRK